MIYTRSGADALAERTEINSPGTGKKHWGTVFFGPRSSNSHAAGPQATMSDLTANEAVVPHFHGVTMFQLFVAGHGTIGSRGQVLEPLSRLTAAPALPTVDESGLKGFVSTLGHGIVVPAATSHALIDVMNRAVNAVLKEPDYRKIMSDDGVHIVGGPPERLKDFLATERRKWGGLVRKLGIKGE